MSEFQNQWWSVNVRFILEDVFGKGWMGSDIN